MSEHDVKPLFQSGKLKPSDKLVYLCLLAAAGGGNISRASIRAISYETGLCERTVRHAVKRLKELNLISVNRQPGLQGRPNEYALDEGPKAQATGGSEA